MRAIVVTEPGGPENLRWQEVDDPARHRANAVFIRKINVNRHGRHTVGSR